VTEFVDLSQIPDARDVTEDEHAFILGAGVTLNEILLRANVVRDALPLAQACLAIGSPQLRNIATVCGNLATASPAGDTLPALIALGASLDLVGPQGARRSSVDDFIVGYRSTSLRASELVTRLTVPKLSPTAIGCFAKAGLRQTHAIALASAAVVLEFDDDCVAKATIILGAVASRPTRAQHAEALLEGERLNDSTIRAAAQAACLSATPIDDLRASRGYRIRLVEVLTSRLLDSLRRQAERDSWPQRIVSLGSSAARRRVDAPERHSGTMTIEARVNGRLRRRRTTVGASLLEWLRDAAAADDQGALRGTKDGCGEGECGACTVIVDDCAVLACLMPAARAEGANLRTIEGVAATKMHPLQRCLIEYGAVQCGFCTPGIVMAAVRLLEEEREPDDAQITMALSGNLCRCTGYGAIRDAIRAAARSMHK
jgi:Aerobic-type carbon monoxide dehydrogenase, small subunit CoxS/CutS homologs